MGEREKLKDWEWLGIGAAVIAIGLVIENNSGKIKGIISNIHDSFIPTTSIYHPVSQEQIVYHGAPPPGTTPKGVCKPGHYLDQTDGILHCVDPSGTRQLNPIHKQHIGKLDPYTNIIQPDQGIAYSKKGGGSDTGSCPPGVICSKKPGQDQIASYTNETNPHWMELPGGVFGPGYANPPLIPTPSPGQTLAPPRPEPQILTGPITPEKKPSHIKKTINDKIDSNKKKVKKHLEPSKDKDKDKISTQVECSDNLKCGSNCYKDGKLWKIVCSEKEKQSLYIPPNFPQAVTVGGDNPYPETDTENQEDIGGTAPGGGEIPSLDLTPGQQPIQPTIPSTSPTPIAPAPQLQGNVFYPFSPAKDNNKKGFAKGGLDTSYNSDGCRNVHYGSGPNGWTCRWQANDRLMRQNIGENGYKIEANLHIAQPKPGMTHDKEISITSGGPGSASGTNNCCGFTTRINIDTGELQLEAEGPAKTEKIFCKGASCTGGSGGKSSIGKNLYGQNIRLTWIVTKKGGKAIYQAIATGPEGTITATLPNPQVRGKDLIPFHYIQMDKMADDPHRIRVDTADMHAIDFGNPKVTVIPANAYFGDDGYIEDPDLLI